MNLKVGWEEMGGIITLRDGQTFTGKPRKSTMAAVKLYDPNQAEMHGGAAEQ